MHHLHVHVVPKYKDQVEWGDVFAMNPHKVEPSQEELQVLIEKFRKELDA